MLYSSVRWVFRVHPLLRTAIRGACLSGEVADAPAPPHQAVAALKTLVGEQLFPMVTPARVQRQQAAAVGDLCVLCYRLRWQQL